MPVVKEGHITAQRECKLAASFGRQRFGRTSLKHVKHGSGIGASSTQPAPRRKELPDPPQQARRDSARGSPSLIGLQNKIAWATGNPTGVWAIDLNPTWAGRPTEQIAPIETKKPGTQFMKPVRSPTENLERPVDLAAQSEASG